MRESDETDPSPNIYPIFLTTIFVRLLSESRVDEAMKDVPKHPQASLWPSEVVTLGVLFALKGVGNRAFYRWVSRDWRGLFPAQPERTRFFRLLATHRAWPDTFLATPSVLGVVDSYGIELLHPMREGRSAQQIGRKGKSNHRWIVGGKLCLLLNHLGSVRTQRKALNFFLWCRREERR
jgi:hypothetical protein